MKQLSKSSVIDYYHIYNVILLALTIFLLYICINFFLPYANFISALFLSLSLFYLLVYFFSKRRLHLTFSLIGTIISILLSLAFIYL